MSPFAVIEAPSILGLRPTGVETMPEALLHAGLMSLAGRTTFFSLLKHIQAFALLDCHRRDAICDVTTLTLRGPRG